jgi:hypothetical protein
MKLSKKCGKVAYSRSNINHYNFSIKRIYVKFKRSWKTTGWICPDCRDMIWMRIVTSYFIIERIEPHIFGIKTRLRSLE